jgi:hypothetical protein
MGSEYTLAPNTFIASLVRASLPTTQTVKEFDEPDLFPDVHTTVKHLL